MSISTTEMQRIAKLACLKLDTSSMEQAQDKLSHILELVDKMNSIDTDDSLPMAHPMDLNQPLREDVVTASNQRTALQLNVKYTQDGFYIVPQFIETE